MAMVGSIALAVIVVGKVGGPSAMVEQVREAPAAPAHVFDFVPDFTEATGLVVFGFLVQISMQWWQQAQGDGYIVQRLASTRSEKDSFLALLWFNSAHYVLRPWPWILVGLASIILWPITAGEDPELAYPRMIADHLPAGLKGLMVASLLAAFMSTMDTQLNWGASYLVNDVYRRFLVRDADARHYVLASRVAILLLMGLAAFVAWQLETIEQAWFLVFLLGSGLATVWMLRWFWWRVNAWCEIAALATSLLIAFGGPLLDVLHAGGLLPDAAHQGVAWFYSGDAYYVRLVTNLAVATAVWVTVALVTRPVAAERLGAFYRKVRPGGWWGPVAAAHPDVVRQDLRGALLGWVSGSACIYAGLFGVGNLCLARWGAAVVALAVAGAAGAVVLWVASRREQGGEGPTRASGNAGNR
jgi:SSS family solute:Na+ symporter